jgi:hypothetical protein
MDDNLIDNRSPYLWDNIMYYSATNALICILNGILIFVFTDKGIWTGIPLKFAIACWVLHVAISLHWIIRLKRR